MFEVKCFFYYSKPPLGSSSDLPSLLMIFFFFGKIYKVTHKFLQSSVGICLIKISEIYSKTAYMGSGSHPFVMCYGQFCLKIVPSDRKGLTTIFKCYLC